MHRRRLPPGFRIVMMLAVMACRELERPRVQRPEIVVGSEIVRFDALGDARKIAATVLGADGSAVPGAIVRVSSSDSAVARVSNDTVFSQSNGTATLVVSSGPLMARMGVVIAQVGTRIVLERLDSTAIADLSAGEPLPIRCRVLDKNGFETADQPVVAPSSRGVFTGGSCSSLVARRSGVDTVVVTHGRLRDSLPLPVAVRPSTSATRASTLEIDGVPAGRYPWAPSLRRRDDGTLELYATLYDSLTWVSGDLHRFTSSDGVHFRHDELVLAHDRDNCTTKNSGIENVVVVPRGDGAGSRLLFSAGSFDCYGWQVFSAVSTDGQSWTIEPGVRLSNGGSLPPNAPVYAPWPVGEGMDLTRTASGEWLMLVGGYEHLTPYDDKFQIIEWRSSNQIDWTYVGPVLTTRQMPPGGQSTIYSPSVREFAPGLYRMVFAGDNRGAPGSRGRIWTAVSTDRLHWQFEGELLGDASVSYYYASLVDDRLITIMLPIGAPLPQGHLATVTVVMP